ncbi:MAG: hypothetical protein EAZ95_09565 [Bacteroidetes bacterium]|nr:MAG: hypothetical protein EAZ95_09565 [Bacteroidota bacterium]
MIFLEVFNLTNYSITEHALFALGCLLWVFTYFHVIRRIFSCKTVGIPWVAICANFSWEFLWSFVFKTDMGSFYEYGYIIWFCMDCVILYGLFVYGYKQLQPSHNVQQHALWIFALGITSWMVMLYYYIDKWDAPITQMGANSGYILNVMMSALYIDFLFKQNIQDLSIGAAWYKGVGTFFITIFCFLHFKDGFLLSMCVVTTVLDAIYIYLFMQRWTEARIKA